MSEEESNLHPWIDPDLEASIVALVLGEASDFETEKLERLIEEQPELAIYRKRIEKIYGLCYEVAAGEPKVEDATSCEPWRLSDDRRKSVLAAIGDDPVEPGTAAGEVLATTSKPSVTGSGKVRSFPWRQLAKIAAVLCLFGVLVSLFPPSFARVISKRPAFAMASEGESADGSQTASLSVHYATFGDKSEDVAAGEASILANSLPEATEIPDSPDMVSLSNGDTGFGMSMKASRDDLVSIREKMKSRGGSARDLASIQLKIESLDRDGDGASAPQTNPAAASLSKLNDALLALPATPATTMPSANAPGLNPPEIPKSMDLIRTEELGVAGNVKVDLNGNGGVTITGYSRPDMREVAAKSDLSFPSVGNDMEVDRRSRVETSNDEEGLGENQLEKMLQQPKGGGAALEYGGPSSLSLPEWGLAPQSVDDAIVLGGATTFRNERTAIPEPPSGPQPAAPDAFGRQADKTVPLEKIVSAVDAKEALSGGGGNVGSSIRLSAIEENFSRSNDSSMEVAPVKRPGLKPRPLKVIPAGSKKADPLEVAKVSADAMPAPLETFGAGGMVGLSDLTELEVVRDTQDSFFLPQAGNPTPGKPGAEFETDTRMTDRWYWDFRRETEDPKPLVQGGGSKREIPAPRGQIPGQDVSEARSNMKAIMDQVPRVIGGGSSPAKEEEGKEKTDTWYDTANLTVPEVSPLRGALFYDIGSDGDSIDELISGIPVTTKARSEQRGKIEVTREFIYPTEYDPPEIPGKAFAAQRVTPPAGLGEKSAAEESFSTFSLHVSDVSFKLAQASLEKGEWPEAGKVRIEEFVNAFDYGDPNPSQEDKVACRIEQAIHPFLQQRNLMRVSMRTAAAGRAGDTPLRLTFLLDNSGSMERADREETVRRAFALLADQLQPIDQVTLISFARQPRLLADKVSGDLSRDLVKVVSNLPSEGGTNLEAALQLAFEKAQEQKSDNAQNRIVLLTDGAANLGNAKPESLARMVESMREEGIAFDAAGIGAEGLNDDILEALTRKGDGRYYLLDRPEDADDGFARQIAGAFRPAAKNVKVQVEFNPDRVGNYKLLGFEKHLLKKEDFRDDSVDAAEMAAEEAGVAVYQFEAKPDGKGDVGFVSVRFRDMSSGEMVEKRWPIPYEPSAPRPDQAAPSMQIATAAALLAAKLNSEPLGETVDLDDLARTVSSLPESFQNKERVQQLRQMIDQARELAAK